MAQFQGPKPAYLNEVYLGNKVYVLMQLQNGRAVITVEFDIEERGEFDGPPRISTHGEGNCLEMICSGFNERFKREFLEDFVSVHRPIKGAINPYGTVRELYEAFVRMYAPELLARLSAAKSS